MTLLQRCITTSLVYEDGGKCQNGCKGRFITFSKGWEKTCFFWIVQLVK
jgi:hypothetical protein